MTVRPEVNTPLADALDQATPYWLQAELLLEQSEFQQSEMYRLKAIRLVAKILNEIDGFDR